MAVENLDDVYTYILNTLDEQILISIKEYSLANIALLHLYLFKPDEQIAEKITNNYQKILDIIHENKIKLNEDPFVKEILPIFLWGFNRYCILFKSDLCNELRDIANLLSTSQRIEKHIKIITLAILHQLEQDEEKKNMFIEQAKQLLDSLDNTNEKIIALYCLYVASNNSTYLHDINSLQLTLKVSPLTTWQLCFYDKSIFKEEILAELSLVAGDKLTFITMLSGCILALKDTDDESIINKFLNIVNAITEPSLVTVDEQPSQDEIVLGEIESEHHLEEQILEDVTDKSTIEPVTIEKIPNKSQDKQPLIQIPEPEITKKAYSDELSVEVPIEPSLIPKFDFKSVIVSSFLQRVLLYYFRTYFENMYFTFDSIECTIEQNLSALLSTCHINILKMNYSFDNTITYNDVPIFVYKDSDDNILALSFCQSRMSLVIALLHITKSKSKAKLRISDICSCNKR